MLVDMTARRRNEWKRWVHVGRGIVWRDRRQLRTSGTWMLALSWIPYVYPLTLSLGLASGVVVDVNRVNNLALLQWLDRMAEDAKTAE